MKNEKVAAVKMSGTIHTATPMMRKASVNPVLRQPGGLNKKPENRLVIQGYAMREWLDSITSSKGAYFLELSNGCYSLHYKDHESAKLMELDYQDGSKDSEEPEKEFLEALIFDLSLFQEEPILVFDSKSIEKSLYKLAATYYENTHAICSIIGRLLDVDIKTVFETGIYEDSQIKEVSLDSIYHTLYPGTSISFSKYQGSYGMYLIFIAIQSVFYQVIGKRI